MMQGQHKEILKELKQGLYDDRLEDFFAGRGEIFTSPRQAVAEASPPVLFASDTEAPLAHPKPPQARAARSEATPSPGPEILDLDSIPTPPPQRMRTPEPLPVHGIRPTLPGRGTYTFKRPTRDIAVPDPNETGTPPTAGGPPRPRPQQPRVACRGPAPDRCGCRRQETKRGPPGGAAPATTWRRGSLCRPGRQPPQPHRAPSVPARRATSHAHGREGRRCRRASHRRPPSYSARVTAGEPGEHAQPG